MKSIRSISQQDHFVFIITRLSSQPTQFICQHQMSTVHLFSEHAAIMNRTDIPLACPLAHNYRCLIRCAPRPASFIAVQSLPASGCHFQAANFHGCVRRHAAANSPNRSAKKRREYAIGRSVVVPCECALNLCGRNRCRAIAKARLH